MTCDTTYAIHALVKTWDNKTAHTLSINFKWNYFKLEANIKILFGKEDVFQLNKTNNVELHQTTNAMYNSIYSEKTWSEKIRSNQKCEDQI